MYCRETRVTGNHDANDTEPTSFAPSWHKRAKKKKKRMQQGLKSGHFDAFMISYRTKSRIFIEERLWMICQIFENYSRYFNRIICIPLRTSKGILTKKKKKRKYSFGRSLGFRKRQKMISIKIIHFLTREWFLELLKVILIIVNLIYETMHEITSG